MNKERNQDIEELLKNIPPVSVPPGLRGRILGGIAKRRAERTVLSPLLRVCFIVSMVVSFSALAADAILARREGIRTAALFPSAVQPAEMAEDPILQADVLAAIPNDGKMLENCVFRPVAKPDRRSLLSSIERDLLEEESHAF
jgi:hypothetical protein